MRAKERRNRRLPADFEARLAECLVADAWKLRRRAAGAGASAASLEAALAEAERRVALRRERLPVPKLDSGLPILELRDELEAAMAANPVVVVCGATGSGKSTQLPQLALAAGRGRRGYIGHTQPRRIAASTIAQRLAGELDTEIGGGVGYKIRFRDRVSPWSAVKLMTDGVLLAEIHSDRDLLSYDTLILDETHERSLNIDFLLGYLRRLLPRRPDLRLVVTSATIDPERYSAFFSGAPVIEIPGRSHPVEVRYRPPGEGESLEEAVARCALALVRGSPGDVLAFLPGEREIARSAALLRRAGRGTLEVLPLYARLSRRDQERIFAPGARGTRVVLATNVAETSITVPGIRFVVDSGLARIARYATHAAVQRLPVEPVSRASAEQRKGRAGRTAPGICIRLFTEEDFAARAEFTEPEIRRSGLDGVLLRMAALDLGAAEDFPFLDPPEPRAVRAGRRDLTMLGALDGEGRLTGLGRRLARLPLDPRLARILLEAASRGVVAEALTVVAALSVVDPRERPADGGGAARVAHGEFAVPDSDFLSDLALWSWYCDARSRLSRRALEAELRRRFLAPARMREWQAVRGELARLLAREGVRESAEPGSPGELHRAILSGFLDRVAERVPDDGQRDGAYRTARGKRVDLFPASALYGRRPRFIVAAELVETSRIFAHHAASVRAEWVEEVAAHLVRRSVDAPRWDPAAGKVLASEDVVLFGLHLARGRTVEFARSEPAAARRIFIRDALVEGALDTRSTGVARNRRRRADVELEEARGRRRDLAADPGRLLRFYEERLPAGICDAEGFERWIRRAERRDRRLLEAPAELFERAPGERSRRSDFPDRIELGPLALALRYRFAPGAEDDGLTVSVPAAGLAQLDAERAEWLVPGLFREKLEALLKSLPKSRRRHFVPARDFAQALAERLDFGSGDLASRAAEELRRMTGVDVRPEEFRSERLPPHLVMRYEVLGTDGGMVAAGRDLERLREGFADAKPGHAFALPVSGLERDRVEEWDFGDLPGEVVLDRRTGVRGYPALVADGDAVALRILASRAEADRLHRDGLVAMLRRPLRSVRRELLRSLPLPQDRRLARLGLARDALVDDIVEAVLLEEIERVGAPRRTRDFALLLDGAQRALVPRARRVADALGPALDRAADVLGRLDDAAPAAWRPAFEDMRAQVRALFFPGFVRATPGELLKRMAVYVAGMERRLQRLEEDPARDLRRRRSLASILETLERAERAEAATAEDRRRARFAVEELRIQTFAQELGARGKTSVARVARMLESLAA